MRYPTIRRVLIMSGDQGLCGLYNRFTICRKSWPATLPLLRLQIHPHLRHSLWAAGVRGWVVGVRARVVATLHGKRAKAGCEKVLCAPATGACLATAATGCGC